MVPTTTACYAIPAFVSFTNIEIINDILVIKLTKHATPQKHSTLALQTPKRIDPQDRHSATEP
jgi:hypothetical protein